MSDRKFEVTVLREFCKGCGLCVEFCELGKLYIADKPDRRGVLVALVRPDVDCSGCLRCATMCPDAALVVTRVECTVAGTPDAATD
jgi:2-oxoglutarate ferredoxin oxidoreductase subunit delta